MLLVIIWLAELFLDWGWRILLLMGRRIHLRIRNILIIISETMTVIVTFHGGMLMGIIFRYIWRKKM